jgi:hypothetical protein
MTMPPIRREQGAIIVTVAFTLLFLLGFMAFALDFGHLFVVKDEIQTSMDSCALAAVQELDGNSDALTRARSAGRSAGNLNSVNFQSGTWSGKGKIVDADVTFKDAAYAVTTVAANARYAQCAHTQSGIGMWLLQSMGAFAGTPGGNYASTADVGALAVATLAAGQSACPVPVGIKPKGGGTSPNYGFTVGEWITVLNNKVVGSGEMGFYNLDGSTSASETSAELGEPAKCGIKISDSLGTPGAQTSVSDVWNARFGIYKNADPGPSVNHPDFSGYAYTSTNWKNASPQNAYAGTPIAGSDPTAANFKTKRAAFASYDDTGTAISGNNGGDKITGLSMNGGFKTLATPGSAGEHQQYGYNRRIVAVPVINGSSTVQDFLCMFMLQPMSGPTVDVQMEFLGNTAAVGTPCASSGLAGASGGAGVKVPVLVQ